MARAALLLPMLHGVRMSATSSVTPRSITPTSIGSRRTLGGAGRRSPLETAIASAPPVAVL